MKKVFMQCPGSQLQLEQNRVAHLAKVDMYCFIRACQFLWMDYRPELYYFEMAKIWRRINLTAWLAILATRRSLQLLVGNILSSIFTLIAKGARLLVQPDDNMVSIATELCTTGSLFVFFLLRISILGPVSCKSFVIALALTPFVFVAYTLRWFWPGCAWRLKPHVMEAVDDDGIVSSVPPSDGMKVLIRVFTAPIAPV